MRVGVECMPVALLQVLLPTRFIAHVEPTTSFALARSRLRQCSAPSHRSAAHHLTGDDE
jgi:hypothetical protein